MSVYSNEAISRRNINGFTLPKTSLSQEVKAVLAAVAVWAVLLGVVALRDGSENADLHSSTNVEDLRFDMSGENQESNPSVPLRQHY